MTSSKKQNINIVWFKRDLRIHDNQALTAAAKNLPIIPLYVFEPEYWQLPDTSMRQWQFIYGSLLELHQNLKCLGQGLLIKQGGVVDVLQALSKQYHIHKIYSHQETGNNWTFQRDIAVQNWCNQQGVEWVQYLQFAIVRGYLNRDSWDEFWQTVIRRSLIKAPQILKATIISNIEVLKAVKVKPDENLTELQWPGRYAAVSCLKSFLQQRGQFYQKEMSSPNTAYDSCSRLSTHIAYGTISLTEIFHALKKKQRSLCNMPEAVRPENWLRALRAFESRLHWHCHFIQKLESEHRIEYENLLSQADGLRENDFNDKYFEAWKIGCTGFPFVDACMRALIKTGWINFRMRAMLVSFATYQLWLHWQPVAHHLAMLFTDYEPGIHYSQVQMQAGTTGINAIRVYNPIKQGVDHDPDAIFIRKWVPEIAMLTNQDIHQPWNTLALLLQEMNIVLGETYPLPIVDNKIATKQAKDKIYALKKQTEVKIAAKKIYLKHGSRKNKKTVKRKKHEKPI